MITLQSPMNGVDDRQKVRHRSEYPGGEEAYLLYSINNGFSLIELPIDMSVALGSGKYKFIRMALNYEEYEVSIRGRNAGSDDNFISCDDCFGFANRINIANQYSQAEIAYSPCQKEGFYAAYSYQNTFSYVSSQTYLEGDGISCPGSGATLESLMALLPDTGEKSEKTITLDIRQTGYAAKPFHHDYWIKITGLAPGNGAFAVIKLGKYEFKLEYQQTTQSSDIGFDGTGCGAIAKLTNFGGLTAEFV
jgi:hypothetical protein